jgi:hypothetical protein
VNARQKNASVVEAAGRREASDSDAGVTLVASGITIPDRHGIGGNGPPDPIDEATAPFEGLIGEAEGWLDGARVETEGQMQAVDALIREMKAARKALDAARDLATKPLHQAWKAEVARWTPTQDDFDRIIAGLVAAVDPFKRALAEQREAERREAERKAREAAEAARDATRTADPADIEAQREAAWLRDSAEAAKAAAAGAEKNTVKGLRTYTVREIIDGTACARWLWVNDREALLEWMGERVKRLTALPDGVTEAKEKRAF